MELGTMLDRCQRAEERAGALYRTFAARTRTDPPLCALWTSLAREEEEHAHSLRAAHAWMDAAAGWQTRVDGWEEALAEVERHLAAAEQGASAATRDEQLAAALELEMTELDVLRHLLLVAAEQPEAVDASSAHATRLAEYAAAASDDPHVQLLASLALARARIPGGA